ncbi:MAG: hypothetical protein AAF402_09290 [Pseudomonadota bacterium]
MTAKSFPPQWTKPIVNSVILPAHAATSTPGDSFELIDCGITSAAPENSEEIVEVGQVNACPDITSSEALAFPTGSTTIVGTPGAEELRVLVSRTSQPREVVTEVTRINANGMQFCVAEALSISQVELLLSEQGFTSSQLSVISNGTSDIDQGTDSLITINRDIVASPGTSFIGDLDACRSIIPVTGQVTILFDIDTVSTIKVLRVHEFSA